MTEPCIKTTVKYITIHLAWFYNKKISHLFVNFISCVVLLSPPLLLRKKKKGLDQAV